MRGAAVRVEHAGNARRLLPNGSRGQIQGPSDPQTVPGVEGDARSRGEMGGVHYGRQRVSELARLGPLGGSLRHGQKPQVLRLAFSRAHGQEGRRVRQPADGDPHALERVDDRRPRGGVIGQVRDQQIDQAIVDLGVGEALAVRRGQRHVAPAAARLAVLALSRGEDGSLRAVGRDADGLEPTVVVRDQQQPGAVRQPARTRLPGRLAGDQPLPARGRLDDVDLSGEQIRQPL